MEKLVAFVYALFFILLPARCLSVSIDVIDDVTSSTPVFIGANEGGQFSVEFMVDCGINAYRLYAGMNRTEYQDDDGVYGSPSIAEIKADQPKGFSTTVPWSWWDNELTSSAHWWYAPGFGGYDPYDPQSNPSGADTDAASANTDGDAWSDLIEALCGGDPLMPERAAPLSGSTSSLPAPRGREAIAPTAAALTESEASGGEAGLQ